VGSAKDAVRVRSRVRIVVGRHADDEQDLLDEAEELRLEEAASQTPSCASVEFVGNAGRISIQTHPNGTVAWAFTWMILKIMVVCGR
jgi:hypothetical protein